MTTASMFAPRARSLPPAASAAPPRWSSAPRDEALPLVLIVDDEEIGRETLSAVLAREPVRVACAASGAEALAFAREHDVDTVLLDVMMPRMDGFETCRQFRADPTLAATPIILVTALDTRDTLVRGLEAGAEEFVTKPVDRVELRARLRSMLRLRREFNALREMNDRLTVLQRQRAALMSFVVHDLRNPLSVIAANAMLCADDDVSADTRRSLDDIIVAATTLERMVTDLLDMARAEQTRLAPDTSSVRIESLVRDSLCAVRALADERHISLDCEVPLDLCATVDAELLRRVLVNLLDNAINYGPAGAPVHVSAAARDGAFELRVIDQGAGIHEDQRARIFDPYVRLDAARGSRSGRGLGLAFCRMVAEAHGGTMRVESAHGNAFVFTVPQPPAGAAPSGDRVNQQAPQVVEAPR